VEEPPAFREVADLAPHLRLGRILAAPQVSASGLDELDVREPVQAGDLQRAVCFLHGDRRDGATQHGRVVGRDDALHAGNHADACHEPAADGVIGVVARERAQLKEWRIPVEQQFNPFSHEELAPLPETGDAALATPCARGFELYLDLLQQTGHGGPVRAEALRIRVDVCSPGFHRSIVPFSWPSFSAGAGLKQPAGTRPPAAFLAANRIVGARLPRAQFASTRAPVGYHLK
jgi:hypothetical protein